MLTRICSRVWVFPFGHSTRSLSTGRDGGEHVQEAITSVSGRRAKSPGNPIIILHAFVSFQEMLFTMSDMKGTHTWHFPHTQFIITRSPNSQWYLFPGTGREGMLTSPWSSRTGWLGLPGVKKLWCDLLPLLKWQQLVTRWHAFFCQYCWHM